MKKQAEFVAMPFAPVALAANHRSGYPDPYRESVLPREKRALGDAAGLTRFGVNHTTLGPGAASSARHWHTHEDEFVWVLEGELVLVTDAGERTIRAGECAGFPAGRADGHHFLNRSGAPVRYLEVGNRDDEDAVSYPDIDLRWNAPDARGQYTHKDGRPY